MKHSVTLLGNVMVQALHLGVVSEQIQALTVRFPQKLHPRSEEQSVSTILGVFSTHSAQENTEIIFMGEKKKSSISTNVFTFRFNSICSSNKNLKAVPGRILNYCHALKNPVK